MTPAETITILRQHNEWRLGNEDLPQHAPKQITDAIYAAVECVERLEAAEKERDALRLEIQVREAERKRIERERDNVNAAAIGVALRADALQAEIDNIKEVQFDLKVSAVADGWRGKCERLEKERDEFKRTCFGHISDNSLLRAEIARLQKEADRFGDGIDWIQRSLQAEAQIEAMEKQEPVTAQQRFQRQQEMMAVWLPWQTTEIRKGRPARTVDVLGLNVEYRELYALPGAQPVPSVPDGFAWPECPKRRQSHVLFDDGYEEGWAACVATIKAALAAPELKP